MSQVAINWCICKGMIPIPGAKTVEQAQQNLGALGWSLDAWEIEELDRVAANSKKTMVQNNFQTTLNSPGLFEFFPNNFGSVK